MAYTFKDIIAWQKSYDYCLYVYKVSANFPEFERFGLRSQFTRAAVSITANIAEGYKKLSRQDKLRFLNISQGSLEECRNYNLLSRDLGYISDEEYNILEEKIEIASKFINSYCNGIINNNGVKD
ncbi:MAG: four helix bundle protein [Prevotella sp.]|jgi:four helix bundle protein|nr:four helix bundle protein [Prevotella sp.]MBR4378572.1 four helix bundle protein [Prevotella sp.]